MRRALLAVVLIAFALVACSEDENPFWWTDGSRGVGEVIPDTLLLEASRDTTVEVELSTGSSQILMVGRLAGVESVAFLRYTSLPDSSDGIESAEIAFLVAGGSGPSPVRLQLDAVANDTGWNETDIRWDTQPPVAGFSTSRDVEWAEGDTIRTLSFDIPIATVIGWIDDPETNGGLRLSLAPGEEDAVLEILSSEAVLDTSITIVNPPLTIDYEFLPPSTHGPSNDAFVHHRFDGTAWGEDPQWLGIGGWRTRRSLIGFDIAALRDSIRVGPTFSVAAATLILQPLEGAPDDLPYADTLSAALFALGDDPAWGEDDVADSLDLQSTIVVQDVFTGAPAEFRVSGLVRDWIESRRENGGVLLASSRERTGAEGLRFAARADAARAPRLRIILTRPAPTRFGSAP